MAVMNRACIWGGFLFLRVFSPRVLRNLTDSAKDGSGIVAYYHLGILDAPELFLTTTPADAEARKLEIEHTAKN